LFSTDAGSYSLVGKNVNFPREYKLVSASGQYLVLGSAATLRADRQFYLLNASYSYVGEPASLRYSRNLLADGTNFDISGFSAGLIRHAKLPIVSGTYAVTGLPARLFLSQFFTGDMEYIYVAQELNTITIPKTPEYDPYEVFVAQEQRTMTISEPADRNATYRKTMAVAPEWQIMYVPSKDFTAEDPVHTDLQPQPRQRALV
jgi:hypothetical protein